MAAQSSTLEPGYLYLQAFTARFTNNLAAIDLLGAEATMLTTSWLVSTSHICVENRKYKFWSFQKDVCKSNSLLPLFD